MNQNPLHSSPASRLSSQKRCTALLFFVLWITTSSARGDYWFFQPGANISAGYEENAQLAATDEGEQNTQRYEVEALASGGRRTETSEIIFDLGINWLRYPQARELDSDNLRAGIGSAFRPGLDLFRLDATYDRDTSRQSELTTTGDIEGNVPRHAYTITPSWSRPLTERSEVGITYAYTNVAFDEDEGLTSLEDEDGLTDPGLGDGLVDYELQDLEASYNFRITERVTFQGALGASFYRPETPQSYDTYTASLGLSYAITETLTGDFFVGPLYAEAESEVERRRVSDSETGNVFGINLAKIFERGALTLELSKGLIPTGGGEPVDQTELNVAFSHDFTERLAFSLPASVYRTENVQFFDAEDEGRRLFFQAEPALSWRITEDLNLTASYRYRYQHRSDLDETARSNAVFLSLSYLWPTEPVGLASPLPAGPASPSPVGPAPPF